MQASTACGQYRQCMQCRLHAILLTIQYEQYNQYRLCLPHCLTAAGPGGPYSWRSYNWHCCCRGPGCHRSDLPGNGTACDTGGHPLRLLLLVLLLKPPSACFNIGTYQAEAACLCAWLECRHWATGWQPNRQQHSSCAAARGSCDGGKSPSLQMHWPRRPARRCPAHHRSPAAAPRSSRSPWP